MLPVTIANFRLAFPAFADGSVYTDVQVQFYLDLASGLVDPVRWGDTAPFGAQLATAHFLSLNRIGAVGGVTGVPGSGVGIITSATVDKVSYTRSIAGALDPQNGQWNLTTFGVQYAYLVRLFGAGPVQVGAADPWDYAASAWAGPVQWPW